MPKIIAKSYSSNKSNTTQYNAIQRNTTQYKTITKYNFIILL